jgi:hypothetical protein
MKNQSGPNGIVLQYPTIYCCYIQYAQHSPMPHDDNHCLYLEIAYHKEKNLTGDNHTPGLHYHTYDSSFSKTKEGDGGRSKAHFLADEMKDKYKKYFKGLKI